MPYLGGTLFYTANLTTVGHISGGLQYSVSTIDLGVTKESKIELEVMCDLSPAVCICMSKCSYSTLLVTS